MAKICESDNTRSVTIGQGLAANLGVKPGDTVVLLVNTRGGGINAVDARVRGVFVTIAKAYDDTAVRMPIELARQLLKTQGAHNWIVLLEDTSQTDTTIAALRSEFSDLGLEWVPWYQLADFYNKTSALFGKQVRVIEMIIAVIIVLSISNTMMRSVMERVAEIGTAMALGSRRRQIVGLFLAEGLLLGVVGGVVGVAVGITLASVISWYGIPMPPGPGMTWGFEAGVLIEPAIVLDAVLLAVVATILASLYPAWKASRLEIVDALRRGQ